MNQPKNDVSIEYNTTDKSLHGYFNGEDKYFNIHMPTPDYNKPICIGNEEYRYNPSSSLHFKKGHCLCDVERWWFRENSNSDPVILNEYLSYVVPENGFISLIIVCDVPDEKEFESFSFVVRVNSREVINTGTLIEKSTRLGRKKDSHLIPVSKGDKIHYGTDLKSSTIPNAYRLNFYPVKKYD